MPNESPVAGVAAQAGAAKANADEAHSGPGRDATGVLGRPALWVIRGDPTAAELAAVIAVLGAKSRATATAAGRPASAGSGRSTWSARSRLLRESLSPGRGAWKKSALPR